MFNLDRCLDWLKWSVYICCVCEAYMLSQYDLLMYERSRRYKQKARVTFCYSLKSTVSRVAALSSTELSLLFSLMFVYSVHKPMTSLYKVMRKHKHIFISGSTTWTRRNTGGLVSCKSEFGSRWSKWTPFLPSVLAQLYVLITL